MGGWVEKRWVGGWVDGDVPGPFLVGDAFLLGKFLPAGLRLGFREGFGPGEVGLGGGEGHDWACFWEKGLGGWVDGLAWMGGWVGGATVDGMTDVPVLEGS